jgi:hypothetical protein
MSYTRAQATRVRRAMTRVAGRQVYLDTMTLAEALALSRRTSDGRILAARNVGTGTLDLIREMAGGTDICPACGRPL